MALFKRKVSQGSAETEPAHTSAQEQPRPPEPAPSDVDWAEPQNIRLEWPSDQFDLDADMLGWRNGMRMAAEDEFPAQRFNEAEYMTRALRHHLYGGGPLSDAQVLETVDLVLDLLERFSATDHPDFYDEFMPRIRRLPLAIIRDRGWQPEHLGGDGSSMADLQTPQVIEAIASATAPEARYLEHFFGQV